LDVYGGKGRGIGHRDYILGEEEIREEMGYLEIKDRIELDHPVIAWMRKGVRRRNGGGRKRVGKEIWDEVKRKFLEG